MSQPETVATPPHPKHRSPPAGTANEQAAAQTVRGMFDTIAPSYDRLIHILSVGLDRT